MIQQAGVKTKTKKPQGVNPLPDLQSTQRKVLIFPKKQGPMLGAKEPVIARRLQRHHCILQTGGTSQAGLL